MISQRVALKTLGCKTNHYETDAIRQQFVQAGFILTEFDQEADIYIVNTCTVTGEAERKTRQILRRAKEKNPQALLVALGCSVEISGHNELADICLGTKEKNRAFRIITEKIGVGSKLPDTDVQPDELFAEYGSVSDQSETRAQIKIEDGCNNFCAYCIIPFARGPVRSRKKDNIFNEARALARAGYQEIVLTGTHVCSYGAEWGWPEHAVIELANELAGIEKIKRIRLGSLEPRSLTDKFVELAGKNAKLCPHFHLSLQSGSDATLRQMERNYNTEYFYQAVKRLRNAFADPGITTDIIVGFPGESDEHHRESLEFCREIAFSRMHVFRYSPRRGTKAAARKDRINPAVTSQRSREMGQLAKDLMGRYHIRQLEKQHSIILEKINGDHFGGYTEKYVPVKVKTRPDLAEGDLVLARGAKVENGFLLCDNAILADT